MTKLISTALLLGSIATSSFAASSESPLYYKFTMDSLEKQNNKDESISWSGNIWVGNELNKVFIYSEGEKPKGSSSESENQLVFSRAIAPYWDVQLGVGYDKKPNVDKTWGVVALKGMMPYFIETRAALLAGGGVAGLRFEVEYKALLTQKLALTPSFSTAIYSKDIPDMELGKGISSTNIGLRLSYEIRREFAPYIGVEWKKNYGNTDTFSPLDEAYVLAGFKFWF